MTKENSSKIVIELTDRDEKKSSVKFFDPGAPEVLKNIYLGNGAVKKLGGCENGVKVTIEAL